MTEQPWIEANQKLGSYPVLPLAPPTSASCSEARAGVRGGELGSPKVGQGEQRPALAKRTFLPSKVWRRASGRPDPSSFENPRFERGAPSLCLLLWEEIRRSRDISTDLSVLREASHKYLLIWFSALLFKK